MTHWPDPSRPGFPLNHTADGPHWFKHSDGRWRCVHWTYDPFECEGSWQSHNGGTLFREANLDAAGWVYVGPCLTPDEVATAKMDAEKEGYAVAHDRLVDLRRELQFDPNGDRNQRWQQVGILSGIYYACKAIAGLAPPSKPFDA